MFLFKVAFVCMYLAMSMISSEKMFAEFRKGNRTMMSGVFSQSFVSSRIHCMHKCHRDPRCKGMNLGKSGDDQLTCQLTSTKITNDDDEHLLEENEGWDFYEVVDLQDQSNSIAQKKFDIYLSSYAQQESSDALQSINLSQMSINGKKTSLSSGINIVYLKYDNVAFKSVRRCPDSSDLSGCATFLDKREAGSIIGIVVVDTAVGYVDEAFPPSFIAALKRIGVNQTDIGYRQPFCFINMKERSVNWKQEVLKRNATEPSICHADVY